MEERLNILLDAGMINRDVYEFVLKAGSYINEKYPEINEDKFSMFITHLAMATQRTINKQEENEVDKNILESLKESEQYQDSLDLFNYLINNTIVDYSEAERGYLMVHLCNLLMK